MDATTVDWSMGSSAARIADWDLALQIGRKVAGPGTRVAPAERARMREDFAELVPHAEDLITAHTGMSVEGFRSRAWVMARSEWIRANLTGLQRLLEPLAERLVTEQRVGRGSFKRKAVGAQAGALFGYVGARGCWASTTCSCRRTTRACSTSSGPTSPRSSNGSRCRRVTSGCGSAIHEVTHRVQFGTAPWLRAHLQGLVDAYLAGISLDSREIIEQLKRAAAGSAERRRRAHERDLPVAHA